MKPTTSLVGSVCASAALACVLAGCAATPAPRVETVEVRVPVPVPCDPDRPARAELTPRSVLASLPLGEAVRRLLVEREAQAAEAVELRAALDGCKG